MKDCEGGYSGRFLQRSGHSCCSCRGWLVLLLDDSGERATPAAAWQEESDMIRKYLWRRESREDLRADKGGSALTSTGG